MKVLLALLHLNSNLFLVVLSSAKTVLIMETDCPINSYSRFFDTNLLLWQPQESQQIKTHSQLFASFEQRVFLLDIADQASFQEYEKLLCADDFFSCDKRINVLSLPGQKKNLYSLIFEEFIRLFFCLLNSQKLTQYFHLTCSNTVDWFLYLIRKKNEVSWLLEIGLADNVLVKYVWT